MSANEPRIGSDGGGGTAVLVDDHECSVDVPPAEVYVGTDKTKIPILNEGLRTELRRDGVLDITKHSEVYFPSEWPLTDDAEPYSGAVRALNPNEENVYDPVDVYVTDTLTDEQRLVHRGFVMGVGGGGQGNVERRMTVGDPAQLLGALGFGKSYKTGTNVLTVIEDVVERFRQTSIVPNVFSDVGISEYARRAITEESVAVSDIDSDAETESGFVPSLAGDIFEGPFDIVETGADLAPVPGTDGVGDLVDATGDVVSDSVEQQLSSPYELDYRANDFTAADALTDVQAKLDGILFFRAANESDTSIELAYLDDPSTTHTAEHLGGTDVRVLRNNAIHEIRPINSLEARGDANDDGQFPWVVVRHDELYRRANVELTDTERIEGVTNIAGLEKQATSRLQDRIQESSLGSMRLEPAPEIQPYSVIESHPACGDDVSEDFPPMEYEVERVVHMVSAKLSDREQDDRRLHETQVKVTIPTSPNELSLVTSEMLESGSASAGLWEKATAAIDEAGLQTPVG